MSAAHAVRSVAAARYTGRFAPSPTGPLHAGSLVAALASWLDARAHNGQWLVRIEDLDQPRCIAGAADEILRQLAALGLSPDAPPVYQSRRTALYQSALDQLIAQKQAYPCACSRKDIEAALALQGALKPRNGERVYPGTCRPDNGGLQGKTARAWRFFSTFLDEKTSFNHTEYAQAATKSIADLNTATTSQSIVHWHDRRLGPQQQCVAEDVGDFVLQRADGYFAYQLAVVADDAAQGITHIVRGQDLADNTARQILLQRALNYPTPRYLHTPLVLGTDGEKLSKQNGAKALDTGNPLACLHTAAQCLGLAPSPGDTLAASLDWYVQAWKAALPEA